MKKEQPKWKRIAKGDRLPCWSFIRKMDGTVLPLTTIGGAFSGQDAYYFPVKDVIEIIKDFPKEIVMDYEKKYKEALERVENIKTGKCETTFMFTEGLFEYIFPELKESEDEKVEKAIFGMVYDSDNELWSSYDISKSDVLAWLEKHSSKNHQKVIDDAYLRGISDAKHELEKQGEHTDILDDAILDGNKDGLIADTIRYKREKQGKQNLVSTDLDELVIQLEETIGTSPHSRETIKDFFQRAVQKYMNCLRIANGEIGRLFDENYSLKEKQAEQNPIGKPTLDVEIPFGMDSELVEETMAIPKGCYAVIEDNKVVIRKGEKPAEWSEEDEKMIQDIINDIAIAQEQVYCKSRCEDEINWLKSLRPQSQWRPSDKQMADLWNMVCECRPADAQLLQDLYFGLKTLRGK